MKKKGGRDPIVVESATLEKPGRTKPNLISPPALTKNIPKPDLIESTMTISEAKKIIHSHSDVFRMYPPKIEGESLINAIDVYKKKYIELKNDFDALMRDYNPLKTLPEPPYDPFNDTMYSPITNRDINYNMRIHFMTTLTDDLTEK